MIRARHRRIAVKFFDWYLERIIRKDFHTMRYNREVQADPSRPTLVLANHFSWWDGFFVVAMNKRHFRKRFHVMMLEEELRKRMPLRFAGAYSIRKNSRSLVESLAYTEELLTDPRNLCLIFPQGQIQSVHTEQVEFGKGVNRLIQKRPEAQIIFSVALIDWSHRRKPSVDIQLQDYAGPREPEAVAAAFNALYQASKAKQRKRIREENR